MNEKTRDELAGQYLRALEDYLDDAGEAALARAYELGRRAVVDGLGVLEMAALHHEALRASVLRLDALEARAKAVEAAQAFFLSRLEEVRDLLDRIEGELRRLSHELRPTMLDDLGLLPALQFLAEGVAKRTGLSVEVRGSTHGRLPPAVETALYRIAQEALTNAVRHAHPAHVKIQLQREARAVRCSVSDDGVGFDAATALEHRGGPGLGLVGIRERLDPLRGRLQITSPPGRGTRVHVAVPLEG
ncbi:MAG: hypothetical protein E6J81_19745 [Deltaproteobacteria bacterium]|nr:MAG: hypothetical protein E6J81_19745 [Deltaproteobacteria bacterium]